MKPLVDLALVIRSKNAGPFELTIDIIFKERDVYERVKEQQLLNAALIAVLRTREEDVISLTYLIPLRLQGYHEAAASIRKTWERRLFMGPAACSPALNCCLPGVTPIAAS